ncbi:ATP-binding protein [Haloarchaeobius sp. DFWS5]|uniref:ATP-binding protein n=1 Tax=Haloarchaeobius sp. DFWS5 TaxID=3446114 RepID=UPI003EB9EED9
MVREGHIVTEFSSVSLVDCAERAWERLDRVDSTLVIDEETGTIQGDEARVQFLFENVFQGMLLLGDDDVNIRVGTLENGFFVEDDGPGILRDERKVMLGEGYNPSKRGTALIVNIVQLIATVHNWEVALTERTDGGLRVEFTTLQNSNPVE